MGSVDVLRAVCEEVPDWRGRSGDKKRGGSQKPRQLGAHREGEEPRTGAAVARGRRANEPWKLLTAGELGVPELAERAARIVGTEGGQLVAS